MKSILVVVLAFISVKCNAGDEQSISVKESLDLLAEHIFRDEFKIYSFGECQISLRKSISNKNRELIISSKGENIVVSPAIASQEIEVEGNRYISFAELSEFSASPSIVRLKIQQVIDSDLTKAIVASNVITVSLELERIAPHLDLFRLRSIVAGHWWNLRLPFLKMWQLASPKVYYLSFRPLICGRNCDLHN